jgi:DNA-binding NarL/FixJ family response regulator
MKTLDKSSHYGSAMSQAPRPARLLLCDDQELVRLRVRGLLEDISSIQVVGEATNGRLAVSMAMELKPDIILMDMSMPEMNGDEATAQIVAWEPGIHVIAYSADTSEETVTKMFAAGAEAYVSKTGDPAELIIALAKVRAGERFRSTNDNFACSQPRLD